MDEYERRFESADGSVRQVGGEEPGQEAGVRFSLPGGVAMEVVAITDDEYQHYERVNPFRRGQAPADVDHVQFLTPDITADMEFLRDVAGLTVSEIAGPPAAPEIAFTRCNAFHHDVVLKSSEALGGTDGTSLHHLAFGFDSPDRLVRCIGSAVNAGCEFERGIGRHHGGNNLCAYLWTPGGNRVELCTQMATLTRDEPEAVKDYASATTAWGPEAPESFRKGSGLLRGERLKWFCSFRDYIDSLVVHEDHEFVVDVTEPRVRISMQSYAVEGKESISLRIAREQGDSVKSTLYSIEVYTLVIRKITEIKT